ncbi:MAG: AzlD family protein [Magnetovibrionaceae bacterium]
MTGEIWTISPDALVAILGMGVATYLLRFGGLLAGGALPRRGRLARALEKLPGAVIIAVAIPAVVQAGPLGLIAGGFVLLAMWRTGSLFLALAVGVGGIALLRLLL